MAQIATSRNPVKYGLINAFTGTAFRGNPGAVCLLEAEVAADEGWMQTVAKEFNLSITAFVIYPSTISGDSSCSPSFGLRWFTPVKEVNLCGHGTLAAAHLLMKNSDNIEFVTKSGVLTAKKVHGLNLCGGSSNPSQSGSAIELEFPVVPFVECDPLEIPSLPRTLKGVPMINVHKTATDGDLIVELASGKDVAGLQPEFDELRKCAGRAVIITAPAPPGLGFDFFTRVFAPKLGVNEDQVTGSIHCALAPYWSKKLSKHNLVAYQASPRGGRLELQWEEETQRVRIRGEAVTVMEGVILV